MPIPSPTPDLIDAVRRALASADRATAVPEIARAVLDAARSFLGLGDNVLAGPETSFLDLGFDSMRAVDFRDVLAKLSALELRSTVVFDHPSARELSTFLYDEARGQRGPTPRATEDVTAEDDQAIAIIGVGCRLPGEVSDLKELWAFLDRGGDAIHAPTESRWPIQGLYSKDRNAAGKLYVREGGFLKDISGFDAPFFGVSAREAVQIDPQQRLLLEVAWETLEDAGIPASKLAQRPVGVFVGLRASEYFDSQSARTPNDANAYHATGNAISTAAGRIAYTLGFIGPCFALDTACSASLVAIHQAVASLRRGECSLALAGGVNLLIDPIISISLCRAQMLAQDGRCKTFSASADGYGRAEGCGLFLLKPLHDAERDGDRIQGVILGSAINQDGRSGGLTVPHGPSQEAVILAALADAGVSPAEIGYLEAHGTGTALGDPIEVGALMNVFSETAPNPRTLRVGSVKTNLGHLETAAGAAGLLKILASFEHEAIPRNLHFEQRSPHIDWGKVPFEVPTTTFPWPRGRRRRIAGISSFGFSGTNAHLIVAEPRPRSPLATETPPPRILVSAKTASALKVAARKLAQYCDHPTTSFEDFATTLATGRDHLSVRAALTARNYEEAAPALLALADGEPHESLRFSDSAGTQRRVGFLFTGQGSQRAGMGKDLDRTEPVFHDALESVDTHLRALLGFPIREVLFGERSARISETAYTQPAIFAYQWALIRLWESRGIVPDFVLGHSIGEFAAAVAARMLDLETASSLVVARGRIMQDLSPLGRMISVLANQERLQAIQAEFDGRVDFAAFNARDSTVLSGDPVAIATIAERLRADGLSVQELSVERAFHSPLMDAARTAFHEAAMGTHGRPPERPFYSCLTGARLNGVLSAEDWAQQIRSPVRFVDALKAAVSPGPCVLLELGPRGILSGLARRSVSPEEALIVPSIITGKDENAEILATTTELFVQGLPIDWQALFQRRSRVPCRLPTYPFERERHWISKAETQSRPETASGHPLLGPGIPIPGEGTGDILHSRSISRTNPAWIAEHGAFGETIFPGSAFLEMALSAANLSGTYENASIEATLHAPLRLVEDACTLQLQLTPDTNGHRFEIRSRLLERGTARWTRHVTGRAREAGATPPFQKIKTETEKASVPIRIEEFRRLLSDAHLDYGETFRCVKSLVRTETEVFARYEFLAEDQAQYRVHPALLDAAFQLSAALIARVAPGVPWLPLGVLSCTVQRPPPRAGVMRLQLLSPLEAEQRAAMMDVEIGAEDGEAAVQIAGLQLVRATRSSLWRHLPSASRLLHTIEVERSVDPEVISTAAFDLIIALSANEASSHFAASGSERKDPEWLAALTGSKKNSPSVLAVLPKDAPSADVIPTVRRLLQLIKAIAARTGGGAVRLLVAGSGAYPLPSSGRERNPVAAAAAALIATVSKERPELSAAYVDLEPEVHAALEHQPESVMLRVSREPRGASIRGFPFGLRLGRSPSSSAFRECQALEVRTTEFGRLDALTLRPTGHRALRSTEVRIAVTQASLNFKDALFALGLLRGLDGAPDRAEDQLFGFDAAGFVLEIGEGVKEFSPGDRVLALSPGSLATHLVVDSSRLYKIPAAVLLEDAAAEASVFSTALYALERCADLKPKDTILIHAAAGGVGQAAIQVARRIGARVIATASPGKHAFLRSQGISNVFSSRGPGFGVAVRELTQGRGVDVVLNCLTGPLLQEGVDCLAQGGRFVELGKIGVKTSAEFLAQRPDATYHHFDLALVFQKNPGLERGLVQESLRRFEHQEFLPLPKTSLPLALVSEAFKVLAQGEVRGKVLITMPFQAEVLDLQWRLDKRAAFVIFGGRGALGLALCERLLERGAEHVVLVGRRLEDFLADGQKARLSALKQRGVRIDHEVGSVSDESFVASLFARLTQGGARIAGIINASGVLIDGGISSIDDDALAQVFSPKLQGMETILQVSTALRPDFVLFLSSIAAIFGPMGQAAYAAANASAEALQDRARRLGTRAITVELGPILGDGMAGRLQESQKERIRRTGIEFLDLEEALRAIEQAVVLELSHTIIADFDPSRIGTGDGGPVDPLLAGLSGTKTPLRSPEPTSRTVPAPSEAGFRAKLRELDAVEWVDAILGLVSTETRRVLGYSEKSQLDVNRRFTELGIDSLLAVDLKTRLESSLELTLPATLAFDQPTLKKLATWLSARIGGTANEATPPGAPLAAPAKPEDGSETEASLDLASDADLIARLQGGLDRLGGALSGERQP